MNVEKFEVFFFGSVNPEKLKLQEKSIDYKNPYIYLGLHVDKWLRFNQHIDYVVEKLNKFSGLI